MHSDVHRRLTHVAVIAFAAAAGVGGATAAERDCVLKDQSIQLTREVLAKVGWQGMTFGKTEFLPKTLSVRFPATCFADDLSEDPGTCIGMYPINEAGDMAPVRVQAIEIEVLGNFDVKRRELLGEFYQETLKQTPFQAGRDRYSVGGGFLRLRDQDSIYFPVTSHFEDYSGGEVKSKKGDAYVGANLNATLNYTSDRRDVGIKMGAEVTYVKVTSPWDNFINFLTAPSALAVPFGGKMVGDMLVDPEIEDAKEDLPQVGPAKGVDTEKYDVDSINSFVENTLLNFSDIFVSKLKFDQRTGFFGQNPKDKPPFSYVPVDADVRIVLSKSSDPTDVNSFPSRLTACLLSEALALGLVEQTGTQSITVQNGDTLSDIATRTYGSERLVAEIARKNELANPDLIRPGATLTLPTFDDYAGKNVHVVQQGESLWNIAKGQGEPSALVERIIQLNPTLKNPSRIDPMMTIQVPREAQ